MQTIETKQRVKLLDGCYSASEVRDLLLSSIDDQINFYKLKSLGDWIHDCDCNQSSAQDRIKHLEEYKNELRELLAEAKLLKKKLRINQTLDISFE